MFERNATLRWLAAGLGLGVVGYAAYAAVIWSRFGHPSRPQPEEADALLDQFMPSYDVVERHHIATEAPAVVTLAAARETDLFDSPVVRAVIRAREMILGAAPARRPGARGFLEEMRAMGWGVLAETPTEVVGGAVTQPWEAHVTFRALSPEQFTVFNEPGFVKIAWTLRADATSETSSVFRTETRAQATDHTARARFRRYWSFISPGTLLIRRMMLGPIKARAEQLHRGSSRGFVTTVLHSRSHEGSRLPENPRAEPSIERP